MRTGSGLSLATIERSAESNTLVVFDASLLVRSRSAVAAETLASSTRSPLLDGVVILIRIEGAAPTSRVGRVQVMIWPAGTQVQPMPTALWNRTLPSGSRLVTTRLVASRGPRFETSMV